MHSSGSNTIASTHVSPQATPLSTPKAEQAAAALRARLLNLTAAEDGFQSNPSGLLLPQDAPFMLATAATPGTQTIRFGAATPPLV
jgi:hypothetical protein